MPKRYRVGNQNIPQAFKVVNQQNSLNLGSFSKSICFVLPCSVPLHSSHVCWLTLQCSSSDISKSKYNLDLTKFYRLNKLLPIPAQLLTNQIAPSRYRCNIDMEKGCCLHWSSLLSHCRLQTVESQAILSTKDCHINYGQVKGGDKENLQCSCVI